MQKPPFRIKPNEAVNGVVVRRQFYGFRIHEVFPDHICLVYWFPARILRLYGPLETWFDKSWRPVVIELVK